MCQIFKVVEHMKKYHVLNIAKYVNTGKYRVLNIANYVNTEKYRVKYSTVRENIVC